VAVCQTLLAEASAGADAQMLAALKPAHDRLRKAHTLFTAKGISLPSLAELSPVSSGAAEGPSDASNDATAATADSGATGEISFAKQVAPILVARCGRCHVGRNMGEFSMATYASLMQGSENGPMIEAGKPEESLLIELPPPRPRPRPVPKNEVQVLRDWVAQGAKFDGASEEQPVLELVPPEIARAAAGRGGPGGRRGGPRPGPPGASRPAR
jgi:hypothetical protein